MFCQGFAANVEKLQHNSYNNIQIYHKEFNTRLQHVFSVTVLRLPRSLKDVLQRRFKDVLKTSCKTSWRRLRRRNIVTLNTSWRHVLRMCSRHVLKRSWRYVLKTYWRYVLKMCSRHVLKRSWRHVLKTYWRHVLKMSSRHVFKTS